MTEAGKRGMTVSLSDYTLGVGQGSYVDEMLAEDPTLNGSELHFDSLELGRGERFSRAYAQRPLSLNAYPLDARGRIDGAPVDLLPGNGARRGRVAEPLAAGPRGRSEGRAAPAFARSDAPSCGAQLRAALFPTFCRPFPRGIGNGAQFLFLR